MNSKTFPLYQFFAILILTLASHNTAFASIVYSSFAKVIKNTGATNQQSGFQAAEAALSGGEASAYLDPGAISLSTTNSSPLTRGEASGSVTVSDIMFSRLAGFESMPDIFSGTVYASLSTDAIPGNMSAFLTFQTAATLTGGSDSTFDPDQTLLSVSNSSLEIGTAYQISLSASLRTTTGSPDDAYLALLLGSSFDGSPVFDLPEGYTVNSADGMIVNNYYMGPTPLTAVPLPAAGVLFLSGLGLLAGLKLKKSTC